MFVDDDRAAVHGLKANIDACGAGAQCAVVRADATAYLRNSGGEVFDMIFCDPPYGLPDDDLDEVLRLAAELLGDGYLVLERAKRAARTRWPDTLAPILAKVYGDTRVSGLSKPSWTPRRATVGECVYLDGFGFAFDFVASAIEQCHRIG